MGIIRHTQGKYAEALDYFRQVYASRRESIQLADMMSDASMRVGDYKEAIAVLEYAVNLSAARPVFYLRLAEAYEKTGAPDKAAPLRREYTTRFGKIP